MLREEAKAAGLLVYRTGTPCRNGHVADRYVASGNCVECVKLNGSNAHTRVLVPLTLHAYIKAAIEAAEAVPVAIRARCQTDSSHNLWVDGLWVGRWDSRAGLERYMWNWMIEETERLDRLGEPTK